MRLADKITAIRMVSAPLFFAVYFLSNRAGGFFWTPYALWALFIITVLSDESDGRIARARNECTEFGALFDSFADTIFKVCFGFCFALEGSLVSLLFLIHVLREFLNLYLKTVTLLNLKSFVKVSNKWINVMSYTLIASYVLFLYISFPFAGVLTAEIRNITLLTANGLFAFSLLLFCIRVADYYRAYRKTLKEARAG